MRAHVARFVAWCAASAMPTTHVDPDGPIACPEQLQTETFPPCDWWRRWPRVDWPIAREDWIVGPMGGQEQGQGGRIGLDHTRTTTKADAMRGMERARSGLLRATRTCPYRCMADFGYREVEDEAKADMVHQVFSRVAPSYDVMNDAMSGGLHRRWKDNLVDMLRPFAGMHHLDVAGGTGDVAFRVLRRMLAQERKLGVGEERRGTVTACDINQDMLDVGMERARQQGLDGSNLKFVRGDAEELPFEDESMDAYTIAFGLRNVTRKDRALAEAHRVLRRGGRFLCLEFSRVENPLLQRMYDVYSFRIIPEMGRAIAGDRESYQYLVESIRRFPAQQELSHMVREAGFKHVKHENVMSGVVAYHSGFKL